MMTITKGTAYICIKDVVMDSGETAYIHGRIYKSENPNCLTDEQGADFHKWDDEDMFIEHFRYIPMGYVKRTELRVKTDRGGYDWYSNLKVSARNSLNGIFEYCSDFGKGIIVLYDWNTPNYDESVVELEMSNTYWEDKKEIYTLYNEKMELVGFVYEPIRPSLWEVMDMDGCEKYDAFVNLIKNALAPTDDVTAYAIEDEVNATISEMFRKLEEKYN